MTHDDILAVEYFDQHADEQLEILANFDPEQYDDGLAVRGEFDLIRAGFKAHCLS